METSLLHIAMGLSTDNILQAVLTKVREISPQVHGKYLDIGAGHGDLMRLLSREFNLELSACDYTSELISKKKKKRRDQRPLEVKVDIVDLNTGTLPYPDTAFDLITCTEVIEHIEHYRQMFREIFRTLKPGGTFVVTTPNVLNLRSRIRYLLFGFFSLFGPLHLRESQRYLTGGHINPVSYFYVAHALSDAGFIGISASIDKRQRASVFWLILLWFPIRLFSLWAIYREKYRYKTIDAANQRFVRETNSADLLLGRTVIVGCRKKV